MVITCVNTVEVFKHASLATQVFVYVPVAPHVPGKNDPEVFTYVTEPQLSVATGAIACAAVIPAASLHSTDWFNDPATLVQTGTVLSVMVITCVKLALVLPQSSVKFQTLVRT